MPAAAGALLAALGACEAPKAREPAPTPAIVLQGVQLIHHRPDGTVSIARAEEVTYRRDSGDVAATRLDAQLPPSGRVGRGGVHVVADRGAGSLAKQVGTLEGGVVAETPAGDRVVTSEASYDGASGLVFAEAPVHAEGPGYAIAARTYALELETQRLTLGGGVDVRSGAKP